VSLAFETRWSTAGEGPWRGGTLQAEVNQSPSVEMELECCRKEMIVFFRLR